MPRKQPADPMARTGNGNATALDFGSLFDSPPPPARTNTSPSIQESSTTVAWEIEARTDTAPASPRASSAISPSAAAVPAPIALDPLPLIERPAAREGGQPPPAGYVEAPRYDTDPVCHKFYVLRPGQERHMQKTRSIVAGWNTIYRGEVKICLATHAEVDAHLSGKAEWVARIVGTRPLSAETGKVWGVDCSPWLRNFEWVLDWLGEYHPADVVPLDLGIYWMRSIGENKWGHP